MKNTLIVILVALASSGLFAQDFVDTLMSSGQERVYRVHLPNGTAPVTPVPVVMAFHGLGDNMNNFSNIGFSQLSNTEDFIVVYPQASVLPGLGAGWRIGTPLDGGISDVDFVAQMLDSLRAEYTIDDDRIYATGFSMGGFMSHLLACELNDQIAAIAAHSGTMGTSKLGSCTNALKTPVMHLHGTGDGTIEYPGGNFFSVFPYQGARDMTDLWADLNECNAASDSSRVPDTMSDGFTIDQFTYTDCKDSTEVILYRVNGFPHNWLFNNNDISATPVIWEFFKKHTLENRKTPTTSIVGYDMAGLKIYPNPVNDQLNIELGTLGEEVAIELFDNMGRLLQSHTGVTGRQTLQRALLPAGLYFVKVRSSAGAMVQKVVFN